MIVGFLTYDVEWSLCSRIKVVS